MKRDELTLRQRRFVDEYILNGGNGGKAAVKAGYSAAQADSQGARLLRSVKVCTALAEARKRLERRHELKKDALAEQLRRISFANLRDVVGWDGETLTVRRFEDIPEEIHPAIESIEQTDRTFGKLTVRTLKVKLVAKTPAIQELNKMLGYHAPVKIKDETPRDRVIFLMTSEYAAMMRAREVPVGTGTASAAEEAKRLPLTAEQRRNVLRLEAEKAGLNPEEILPEEQAERGKS